jgi:hypothetical protein
MKNAWQKMISNLGDPHEVSYIRSTVLMLLLFLGFFGVSFYVMIDSLLS